MVEATEAKNSIEEKHVMFDTVSKLSNNSDLSQALSVYAESLFENDICESMIIAMHDKRDKQLICRYVSMADEYKSLESLYCDYSLSLKKHDPICEAFNSVSDIRMSVNDILISTYDDTSKLRANRWNMKDTLCTPISFQGKPFGVVFLFSHSKDLDIDSCKNALDNTNYLVSFVHHSFKLDTLLRHEKIAEDALEERKLYLELTAKLNALQNEKEIYPVIAHQMLELFPFALCSVTTFDEEERYLSIQSTAIIDSKYSKEKEKYDSYFGPLKHRPVASEGACPTAFAQNVRFYIDDAQTITSLPMSASDKEGIKCVGIRSVLHVPIRYNDQPIGVVSLLTFDDVVDISEDELTIAELLCGFIGTAIFNAKLYSQEIKLRKEISELKEQLAKKADMLDTETKIDKKTGLLNDKGKDEAIAQVMDKSRQATFSVLHVDADHFKKINDKHGHAVGNICLKAFAVNLEEHSRKIDIVCRVGGEEFLVILPKCLIADAQAVAERIRKGIEETPVEISGEQSISNDTDKVIKISMTASIGCAQWVPGEDPEKTVKRADSAMYAAKDAGRNQVVCSE